MKTTCSALGGLAVAALLGLFCSGQHSDALYGSGTIEAAEITISSQSMGEMLSVFVEEGDVVQAGQVIARVDTEKLVLKKQKLMAGMDELEFNLQNAGQSIDLAEENLENVKKKFERIKKLLHDQSTTQQKYDDIETAYRTASIQAQHAQNAYKALTAKKRQLGVDLDLIHSRLRDTLIRSPLTGTVLTTYTQAGEMVREGSPIVKIADLDRMKINVYVSEPDLGRIRIGETVDIRIDTFPEERFSGKVAWISPKAEFTPKNVQTREARTDLVYAVKVRMENPQGVFKIGMPADVYF
ncbi:efflux RND transporter periplasmic adaptor subunit [candidate division KSB1 bacterium]|nr:efflux RND transporter periplasmic adaptor subunit [candidate division KSB1 bacterium]